MTLIILDLDQTIIHTLHRFYETFNQVLELYGGTRISWDKFFKLFCDDNLDALRPMGTDRIEFWREFSRRYSGWIHENDHPINGAVNTLEWLKNNGFTVVITTGREADSDEIWWELRVFGLDKYVDEVYTIKDQDYIDKDLLFSRRNLLEKIILNYGVNAGRTIFVGDYWVDMESGSQVGLITVGVLTGCKEARLLREHGARYIVEDISKLPELIEKIVQG